MSTNSAPAGRRPSQHAKFFSVRSLHSHHEVQQSRTSAVKLSYGKLAQIVGAASTVGVIPSITVITLNLTHSTLHTSVIIASNIMQQKGLFSMPGKHKQESGKL